MAPRFFNKHKKKDSESDILFLSTRETAQQTKSTLQQFASNQRTTLLPSVTPDSPRDLLMERKESLITVRQQQQQQQQNSPLCCSPKRTNSQHSAETSPTVWSTLEPPTLQHDVVSSHDMPQQSTSSSHPGSANVSLADSSITTEIAFGTPSRPVETETSKSTVPTTYRPRTLVDLVRKDLKSHNPVVLQGALHQITLDCWDSPEARSLVARAGGVLEILNLLQDEPPHEATIIVAACQALEKLTLDAENELAVVELGGVETLWHLANHHPSGREVRSVQTAAWAVLQNCTCQVPSEAVDIYAWVEALQQPAVAQDGPLAAHACAAAANVCVARGGHDLSGGAMVVAMAHALQRHWHDHEVRADLAHSLGRVCEIVTEEEDV